MPSTISVYDCIVEGRTVLIENEMPRLLQERYFPTSPVDETDARDKVLLDFDEGDLQEGAYVKKGYVDGNTVTFFSNLVDVPRVAVEDGIITSDRDRKLFESLCREQGVLNPNKALAMDALMRIKAGRLVKRNSRSLEKLCAEVLKNNEISYTCDTSPSDPTQVTVSVAYHNGTNPQKFVPSAATKNWGQASATPYDDVCAMIKQLRTMGGRADDLLMNDRAWGFLLADMQAKGLIENQIKYTVIANGDTNGLWNEPIEDAEWVAKALFNGHPLNIIVYNGQYKDKNNNLVSYLGDDTFACVLSPAMGHTICAGAVLPSPAAMLRGDDSSACDFKTGRYIVSRYFDFKDNEIKVRCESNVLPAPLSLWKFISYSDHA
jgi:hypothetical protein